MSNELIDKRDERTKRRKEFKKKVDKIYNLSYKDDEKITLSASGVIKLSDPTVRLLDEGAIVGDDYIDFIIKKGTLEKFMSGNNEILPNIDPAETYTVNLGHMDFATFPILLGEWKKSDLTLVDIGDERCGVDVEVHLDEENPLVQQLKRQSYDVGVSAEFYYHVDWKTTMEIGILVVDEVMIFAYGIVGECGNVNSSGLELKGDSMEKENTIENMELGVQTEEEAATEVTEVTEVTEPTAENEENAENTETSEETETVEDNAVNESEEAETDEAEEGEEGEGEEAGDDDASIVSALSARIQALEAKVTELEQANASLKRTNKRLSGKYQKELEKKEKFKNDLKGLAVELLPDEDKKEDKATESKVTDRNYFHGDGIGEI